MANGSLRLINAVLLVISVLAVGHLLYWWNESRPHIVINPPVDCRASLDFDADYLAEICRAVINAKGPLPADTAQAARVISENASKLGFTWPNNFKINAAGEICNCAGEPFQISVTQNRVTVSCASLYAFYFAELDRNSPGSAHQ